ncbi:hypothetical protein GRI89_02725 [Altererythrobacter salegens]|uniref:Uncharacterized protein n=1 Tax=Croceibacterium salegens TaxID=1737568 RepID=A0A6I4SR67_9SPHN|nr:hypothetical protein [Croceibacterium salegens]MXO58461.1 hypothetical protein [Croceibacterium salegens]
MRFSAIPLVALGLGLTACGSQSDDTPAPTASATGAAAPAPAPLPTEIPIQFQGRWGLNANDCSGDPAAAKGLLTIDASTLRFYESTGTLDEVTSSTEGRLRGNYSFTGEGMEWQRDEILDLRNGGKVLVRREFGEGASPEAFDYTKCE